MLSRLLRLGVRRGALGGSRAWLAVGVAAGALKLALRLATREPEVVYSEKLPPGEGLLISHLRK